MEKLRFELYAKVKMDGPIINIGEITPGEYRIRCTEGQYIFDFLENVCAVDKEDSSILCIEARQPDYSNFTDLLTLTPEMLEHITAFSEFFIYTGAEYNDNPRPVQLLECTFYLAGDKEIKLSEEACRQSIVTSEVEPTSFFN